MLNAVGERIDIARMGVKAGPAWGERGEFVSTADTLATSEYVVDRLNDYPLAHWLLMGAMADLSGGPLSGLQGDGMFSHFRPRYRGTLISNVGMTRERGNQLIADELADLVAFGETFIANPDLPARCRPGADPTIRPRLALHTRSPRIHRLSAPRTSRGDRRRRAHCVIAAFHVPYQKKPWTNSPVPNTH